MKRLLLVVLILGLSAGTAIAAKPGSEQSTTPLRAIWHQYSGNNTGCYAFNFLGSPYATTIAFGGTPTRYFVAGGTNDRISPFFETQAEASEWMILYFIKVNGLNATLADVPRDSNGQPDCVAWNEQLFIQ